MQPTRLTNAALQPLSVQCPRKNDEFTSRSRRTLTHSHADRVSFAPRARNVASRRRANQAVAAHVDAPPPSFLPFPFTCLSGSFGSTFHTVHIQTRFVRGRRFWGDYLALPRPRGGVGNGWIWSNGRRRTSSEGGRVWCRPPRPCPRHARPPSSPALLCPRQAGAVQHWGLFRPRFRPLHAVQYQRYWLQ